MHAHRKPVDNNQPISVCDGGTLPAGSTSITFYNNQPYTIYVDDLGLPGFPQSFPVPPAQGGNNGTATQAIQPAQAGTYSYTTSPQCKGNTPPVIKVQ